MIWYLFEFILNSKKGVVGILNLFRKKNLNQLLLETQRTNRLRRELSFGDLLFLGLGGIIGTGIFVLTGTGALLAGPALTLSFLLAGICCAFAALCYAEFSSMVPISGSAYTYTYLTIGEFPAWLIGWDLALEYLFAASTVSAGWSGYFQNLLEGLGWSLPPSLRAAPGVTEESLFNFPAFFIILLITTLLALGIQASKRVNNIMVIIKISIILLFIIVGAFYVKPTNWTPYAPFGLQGILTASAIVFFAFLGFDAVSSAAEETKHPQRDLPRGILASLAICTLLYMLVSAVVTGATQYQRLKGVDHPISKVLEDIGQNWIAGFIDLGAIFGMTTVLLVLLYAQVRIAYAMSRDGLLPSIFCQTHATYRTPFMATWFFGWIAALIGGLVPLDQLAQLVNIGTLFAFTMVAVNVLILRHQQPHLERKFRCPGVPYIPILSILCSITLMTKLNPVTWIAFTIWILLGIIFYFCYARKKSHLHSTIE